MAASNVPVRFFFEAVEQKLFDPPFYDIIFFLIPLFSQLFLLDPPRFHQPSPPWAKKDNSLKDCQKLRTEFKSTCTFYWHIFGIFENDWSIRF